MFPTRSFKMFSEGRPLKPKAAVASSDRVQRHKSAADDDEEEEGKERERERERADPR